MEIITQNTFEIWKDEASKSEKRLVIFTPYFNSCLLDLLEPINIHKSKIEFITCISEKYLLNNIPQIKALKKLSELKVNIYHLPNLHAKVLIRDNSFLSVGSQNFTKGGLFNIEATSISRNEELIKINWEDIFFKVWTKKKR